MRAHVMQLERPSVEHFERASRLQIPDCDALVSALLARRCLLSLWLCVLSLAAFCPSSPLFSLSYVDEALGMTAMGF